MNKVRQENYQGKSRFVFGGKYILGSSSDNIALVAAYGGLTIGLTVYGFTLAKYMYYTIGPVLPILSYIVAAVGMYHLFRTTFTDPGIIPRGNFETAEEAMQSVVSTDPESGEMNIPLVKLDESGDSHSERILEGQAQTKQNPDLAFYKHRYCHTCKIMRPPKASHCNDCDNCVVGFDHHCFFMGNCIGRRNHKHFFLFLLGASVFCAISTIVGVCGFYSIASQHPQVFVNIRERSNYWIISASLGFVSMVFCNRRHCSSAKNTLLGIAMITFIIGFFLVSDGIEVPYYESPVSFVGYVAAQSPFALWIISNFLGTFWSISRGMTYKEKHTIKKEVLDADRKRAMFKLTWKEKIANVREFLNREQIESQVHGVV